MALVKLSGATMVESALRKLFWAKVIHMSYFSYLVYLPTL